jgi:hypothetical protein
LVEQRIENPRVDGSIPSQATKLKSPFQNWLGLFCLPDPLGCWFCFLIFNCPGETIFVALMSKNSRLHTTEFHLCCPGLWRFWQSWHKHLDQLSPHEFERQRQTAL